MCLDTGISVSHGTSLAGGDQYRILAQVVTGVAYLANSFRKLRSCAHATMQVIDGAEGKRKGRLFRKIEILKMMPLRK